MPFQVGSYVTSPEHSAGTVGEVINMTPDGDLKIEFRTPVSVRLPYGKISIEFWPVADQHLLTEVR